MRTPQYAWASTYAGANIIMFCFIAPKRKANKQNGITPKEKENNNEGIEKQHRRKR